MAALCYQYVIVCTERARNEWPNALKSLQDKYTSKWPNQVETIVYHDQTALSSCLPRLIELRPSYTCFFAHYKDCSINFVESVHCICRQIDSSNSFTDTIWGILTGLEEDDLLFAINQEPLVVSRVLGATPVKLLNFESGSWYSEGEPCALFHKSRGEVKDRKVKCPQDTTEILINELSKKRHVANEMGVDMMITSGHCSEVDWQIGYTYKNGHFVTISSHMMGKSMDGSLYPVTHNGSPKILSAAGNCSVGHIKTANCMALAWMHSVGVVQMTGYVGTTWFGFMGWGVHDYMINMPGAYSFSESFFANNQALVAKLCSKYPEYKDKSYKEIKDSLDTVEKDCLGLLHDRDVVAFYGDPGYNARLVNKPELHLYNIKVNTLPSAAVDADEWSMYEILITINKLPNRPVVHLFPSSVKNYRILEGPMDIVITCRFVLIPIKADAIDKTFRVVYAIIQ